MILPEFNYERQKWDRYQEFHVTDGGFVRFATGELIVHHSVDRGYHGRYGVHVFQVSDQPQFLREGTLVDPHREGAPVVKRSWLPQSAPMLYDHSSRRVVMLGAGAHDADMPSRFRGYAACYFAGADRVPVSGVEISYGELKKLSDAEKALLKEKITVIKAQVRIGAVPDAQGFLHGDGRVDATELLKGEVSDYVKRRLVRYGIRMGYVGRSAQWLELR